MPGPSVSLDFETYNTLDLRKVGADVYVSSPDLVVTVVAWAIAGLPVKSETLPKTLNPEILRVLAKGGYLHAWNANFEWLILKHHYGLTVPWSQVHCTMQHALHAGLPASLEQAGRALGLPPGMLKDNANRGLMMQMARPRLRGGKWHEDDPAKLSRLEAYCRQDVTAERAVLTRIPSLPKTERRISDLDHRANQQGLRLDTKLATWLRDVAKEETARLNQACARLTAGMVTAPASQTAKLTAWLLFQGVNAESLDKDAVTALLAGPLVPDVREVLEIRQAVARSSVRKLTAMGQCLGDDGRVRGQLAYYGASRTGRWSGRLIQPQNMPRPTLPKPILKLAIQDIRHAMGAEWIDRVYGPPLDVVAQSLRSCIVPGPGKVFAIYDFAQIEARVISWLAGQTATLAAYTRGEDIYVRLQQQMMLPSRLHAKVCVLGCGFGMGPDKFQETAKKYGLILDPPSAKALVYGWRNANPEITNLWATTERAARQALFRPCCPIPVESARDKLVFTSWPEDDGSRTLTLLLPSGRQLFYRNTRIMEGKYSSGEITYDGVDQARKQWTEIRTWGGKLVENAVQAHARDCLCDALLRIDEKGLGDLVLSVHDEAVLEIDENGAKARAQEIYDEIVKTPAFAPGLPIGAEGGVRTSYGT